MSDAQPAPWEGGRFTVTAVGRPAPQGSKHQGQHGQMREASPYLPGWRAAIVRDVYKRYVALGVHRDQLPLIVGPVGFSAVFRMPAGVAIDGKPDLDKLLRGTWDALTRARVWEDDSRVCYIGDVAEIVTPDSMAPGADIAVWSIKIK